jgi:hypothetical protein
VDVEDVAAGSGGERQNDREHQAQSARAAACSSVVDVMIAPVVRRCEVDV